MVQAYFISIDLIEYFLVDAQSIQLNIGDVYFS